MWGRVVALELVLERLAARLVALRRPGNRRPKPRRAFSGLQSGWRAEKPRGKQAGVASRPTGIRNRGCPRSEGVLEAALQDCQPDLDQPVGAALALRLIVRMEEWLLERLSQG